MDNEEIFVHAKNIMALYKCCRSTGFRKLKAIKRKLGIIEPKELTVDHVCIHIGITPEQYWKTQETSYKNKPTKGTS
ncbi:hypothetical protein GM921_13410 [Pedobacter sp. LMG 31464]|uniref:Uncharacterized protein n=1 Tax=Pedobacter planticolens TaxID=2679964 RepID=A0A923DYN9_9SPHI|nr:hypothetical protein [Pedobacter planticolens]MBB2146494.1 hypothetical protein [Pedobacter planticolens]